MSLRLAISVEGPTEYDKKFHGPLLLMEMGLPVVRAACPRFNGWLAQIEQLGGNA